MSIPQACAPADPRLVDEAAQWLVLMHSGNFTEADAQRCEHWRSQSPEHQRVWQSAEQLSLKFGSVPPALGMPVLDRRRVVGNRRALFKTLAAMIVTPSAVLLGYRAVPWQMLGARYRTGTGERREIKLADGSQLSMNTATAVDVVFNASQRVIWQRSGEILVQTAPDPQPGRSRPFIIQTAQGSLQALGTRFIVRLDDRMTSLTVLAGAVQARPMRTPEAMLTVPAGQRIAFTSSSIGVREPARAGEGEWVRGVLYAQQMSLADFVAELARYRLGVLRYDPSAADILVSGSFQLHDTDRVLDVLAQTLPLRIDYRSRYWVTITAK
ncbi:FecR domain-containing protein [Pollutimonas sp. H1-120]|uniref:FecR domain-containing protein n=1 Tax=Pollutimonas sp. H1-120 TaxID=3148824 RepID=UPI003B5262C0